MSLAKVSISTMSSPKICFVRERIELIRVPVTVVVQFFVGKLISTSKFASFLNVFTLITVIPRSQTNRGQFTASQASAMDVARRISSEFTLNSLTMLTSFGRS